MYRREMRVEDNLSSQTEGMFLEGRGHTDPGWQLATPQKVLSRLTGTHRD